MLNSILIGAGAGIIAGLIARFWSRSKGKITEGITRIPGRIEATTGIDIPDSLERGYVNIVNDVVATLDTQFSNRRFWRDIIKLVSGKAPELAIDKFLDVFKSIDWSDSLSAQIPAEYLELFNWAKEQIAVRTIKAQTELMASTIAAPEVKAIVQKSEEQIAKDVRASVVAIRYSEPESAATRAAPGETVTEMFTRLAEESRKRKEALKSR